MPALNLADAPASGANTSQTDTTSDTNKEEYSLQAQKLAHLHSHAETDATGATHAVEAKYVTQLDAVVELANGQRLPTVPLEEAEKLNLLRAKHHGLPVPTPPRGPLRHGPDGSVYGSSKAGADVSMTEDDDAAEPALSEAPPISHTNPLFPPLPLYGPPSLMRTIQSWTFRISSAYLSLAFLLAIVIGAVINAVPKVLKHVRRRAMLQNPEKRRPFYEEELKRKQERRAADKAWLRNGGGDGIKTPSGEKGIPQDGEFVPTQGGPDRMVKDVAYYAQRVGLDSETYQVQTEDGFVIELWHIYNPRDYTQQDASARAMRKPEVFHTKPGHPDHGRSQPFPEGRKKYPVLMMHGLLQGAGAFCTNDDDSMAFYLAKSGYDVWLGNNRCGDVPRHTSLTYDDPRMWAWNIRQMGVMDLAALVSRVLAETGFPKLGLIAHSQGTTQTFVALAKEQRPELGDKISVFCALAPAVYAGPLIGKMYFRFMQLIGPAVFRLVFGIHSFIPLMMFAKQYMPAGLFGWLGYHIFSFLFSWYDTRWDRGLRARMFQWAPVYVSAESMRWWLGRECFAQQRCILATRQVGELEDREDEEDDAVIRRYYVDREPHLPERRKLQRNLTSFHCQTLSHQHHNSSRARFAWYDAHFPPLALWVCGADDLVDGRRLLRRFARKREPHVQIVHQKLIEGYEHLDVIWAMDAIEKVGKEVREVIWRTASAEAQRGCRVPVGCERPLEEEPRAQDVPMVGSGGRSRMASLSEMARPKSFLGHYAAELRAQPGRHGGDGDGDDDDDGGDEEDEDARLLIDRSKDAQLGQRRFEQSKRDVADAAAAAWNNTPRNRDVAQTASGAATPAAGSHFGDVDEKSNPFDMR